MINPILLPELRLMLAEKDSQGLFEVTTELHPATVADFTEGLSVEETWEVLSHAPLGTQAEIFSYYSNTKQEEMVLGAGRQRMSSLLEEMASDNRVDLLKRLDENVVQELLPLIAKAERHDIVTLLSYPEHSAGSVMTTEYASLPADITASEALARLRSVAPDNEMIYYIYVLGPERHLMGFVSLRDLILAKPSALVGDLMERDVISVRVDADQEEVAKLIARYDFLAIPVVDSTGKLVGHRDPRRRDRRSRRGSNRGRAPAGRHVSGRGGLPTGPIHDRHAEPRDVAVGAVYRRAAHVYGHGRV
jgi:magnesium transporter